MQISQKMTTQLKVRWLRRRLGKRAVVATIFLVSCLFFVTVLQSFIVLSKVQNRQHSPEVKFKTILSVLPTHVDNTTRMCSEVPQFNQTTIMSVYDIQTSTNYSLQSDNQYFFPLPNVDIAHKNSMDFLNITIVPFSHVDPGYGMTFKQYYHQFVKEILDSMVLKLDMYKDMTFQWAEVVFLERWWRDIDATKKDLVRQFVKRGQLEIVTGGWVMPDEAVTTVESLIDQLQEGHQWLHEHIGVYPKTSWSNDPFGYSGLMPYILQSSGIHNMAILRIHQAIKATLARKGALEFIWRQYLTSTRVDDIVCHVMPYTGYWIRDVCGPNKTICQEYAFMHVDGEHFPVLINESNVAERSKLLYEQYRMTAELYKYNSLYIGLGEDFSYNKPEDWDRLYKNFRKIMDYMNNKEDWNVFVKFGTLSEYFSNIRTNEQKDKFNFFPILSGDFFPYSDWNHDYWTGFYSTRPFQKQFAREIEYLIKIADVYDVFLHTKPGKIRKYLSRSGGYQLASQLRSSRRTLHTFLHHDAITGTSTVEVTSQNDVNLYEAYTQIMAVLKRQVLLISGNENELEGALGFETFRESRNSLPDRKVIRILESGTKFFAVNSLPRKRKDIIYFLSYSNALSASILPTVKLKAQTYPYRQYRGFKEKKVFETVIEVDLPSYSIITILLKPEGKHETTEYIDATNTDNNFVIRNWRFSAEFNVTSGMLVSITDIYGHKIKVEAMFMWYETIQSGAYVFKPLSEAKPMGFDMRLCQMNYYKGDLVSSVTTEFREGITITYKIYNTSGVKAYGLHIATKVNIRPSNSYWMNKEVILRFQTNIHNNGHFFTDQNGFSLIGRKTKEFMPISSNYYPVTKMVVIEDRFQRLTIHTDHSHGVAGLKQGWIEIMLDRTMITDDNKGLGQGIIDNKLTESKFILQIEQKETPFDIQEERYTFETLMASLINELLQNPVILLYEKETGLDINSGYMVKDFFNPFSCNLPCDLAVIGLRNLHTEDLEYNSTSLILHRKSFHCGFVESKAACTTNSPVTLHSLLGINDADVSAKHETSLTHLYTKRTIEIADDLRPAMNEIRSFKLCLH